MFTVDLRPFFDGVVFPILSATLMPIAAWGVAKVAALAHVQINAAQGKALEGAMQNGINFALSRAQSDADLHGVVHPKSLVIANAVNYVLPKVPGALKSLGVTPAGLAQRIEARLPSVSAVSVS